MASRNKKDNIKKQRQYICTKYADYNDPSWLAICSNENNPLPNCFELEGGFRKWKLFDAQKLPPEMKSVRGIIDHHLVESVYFPDQKKF